MLKVTKMSSEKIMMKDSEKPNQKIEVIDGVVKIFEGKKLVKTLKSEKTTKKYIEVIESYKARKKIEVSKKKNNVIEGQEKLKLEVTQEVKEEQPKVETKVEGVEKNNEENKEIKEVKEEQPKVESVSEYINKNKKRDNDLLVDLINKDESINLGKLDKINIGNLMTIDATCKSIPIIQDGKTNKVTSLTVQVASDSKEYSQLLMKTMLQIMKEKFNYDFAIMNNNILEFVDGNGHYRLDGSLSFPLQKGVTSKLRKELVESYYYAKKTTKNIIKAIQKVKDTRSKEEKKDKKVV